MSTDRFVSGVENIYGQFSANSTNIAAGEAVKLTAAQTVDETDTGGETAVGVALYTPAASGDPVAVAMVGAVVRAAVESGVSAGDLLTPSASTNGHLDTVSTATGGTDRVLGIALTAAGTPNAGEAIVLITGPGGEVNR